MAILKRGTFTGGDWKLHKKGWSNRYHTGDLYQDDVQSSLRAEWRVKDESKWPYLRHVRRLSDEWPYFRLLVDFMEVGTDPQRWRDFGRSDEKNTYTYPEDEKERARKQLDRVDRTRVRQLKYRADGSCIDTVDAYNTPHDLSTALKGLQEENERNETATDPIQLRLFVVEDLSRQVIEQLGHQFDIEPDFFREHIFETAWFNLREPFYSPPTLSMDMQERNWFQLRFVKVRYFDENTSRFEKGQQSVNMFNVQRKLYDDENKSFWDQDDPVQKPSPGFTNSKLFTLDVEGKRKVTDDEKGLPRVSEREISAESSRGGAGGEKKPTKKVDGGVGHIRSKASFWMQSKGKPGPAVAIVVLDPTIQEGHPVWRWYQSWDSIPPVGTAELKSCVPTLTIGSKALPGEAKERTFFEDFIYWAQRPDAVLSPRGMKLDRDDIQQIPIQALLRLVCVNWLTLSQYIKTRLSQVDWEAAHTNELLTQSQMDIVLKKLHIGRRLVPLCREMLAETVFPKTAIHSPYLLQPYRDELDSIMKKLDEYQTRIDHLTSVVTATINISDSRAISRITFLATLFVPLSLVGTLFSMSENISGLRLTFAWWALASAAVTLALLVGIQLEKKWNKGKASN